MKLRFSVPCLILLLAGLQSCQNPAAQNKTTAKDSAAHTPRLLAPKDMQADLSILWDAIKEMHPAYGIYTPGDSLQTVYDQVAATLQSPMTEDDFITRTYPLICALRCGHTQIRHSANYQPPAAALPSLPFEVLVKDHHAWVTTHRVPELSTGDEILAVNDTPVSRLIDRGYNLYAGDGYNETFKELYLSEYDGFEDVINKQYHWKPPYVLQIKPKQGDLKTITVNQAPAGGPSSERKAPDYSRWVDAKDTGRLPLHFLKNYTTAWLQAGSYQYADTLVFPRAFRMIREKGVQNLILDLRHNGGGDIRIAAKLVSYLADTPYHIAGDVKSRIPDPAANRFAQYFDTDRTLGFREGFRPGAREGNYYHINFNPAFGDMLAILPLDKKDHYQGNLYVLIDGATFSSGVHTAAAIQKQCRKAVFIGRETAGGAEGRSGGTIQHLTLPHTGIVIEFPWMRFVSVEPKQPQPGRGIIPAYIISYQPEDIVSGRDLDLEKALSLIH